MKKVLLVLAAVLMSTLQMNAQTTPKVDDKELIGAWVMESMQFEGEKKIVCGKASGYSQFKYYGADGEYACAEIALSNDGKIVVMPHEYGTYTFKNGVYSEMGRPAVKPDEMQLIDKNTFKGRWMNRHDIWKKTALPQKAVRYIVDCCKSKSVPADIQQQIKQNLFK
ncbi:MAG: hypothetical protein J5552_01800 [Prevotella sp.]|nr:hypothetical protein [Prevotella sp.]